jgi:hypothetical protein
MFSVKTPYVVYLKSYSIHASGCSTVVEQLIQDPKFKGSNPR